MSQLSALWLRGLSNESYEKIVFIMALSINEFAKFVSVRKEVIRAVLYVDFLCSLMFFQTKNLGTICAEIYEKQYRARNP